MCNEYMYYHSWEIEVAEQKVVKQQSQLARL